MRFLVFSSNGSAIIFILLLEPWTWPFPNGDHFNGLIQLHCWIALFLVKHFAYLRFFLYLFVSFNLKIFCAFPFFSLSNLLLSIHLSKFRCSSSGWLWWEEKKGWNGNFEDGCNEESIQNQKYDDQVKVRKVVLMMCVLLFSPFSCSITILMKIQMKIWHKIVLKSTTCMVNKDDKLFFQKQLSSGESKQPKMR